MFLAEKKPIQVPFRTPLPQRHTERNFCQQSCAEIERILMLKCHLLRRIEFQFELVNQQKHHRNCRLRKQRKMEIFIQHLH